MEHKIQAMTGPSQPTPTEQDRELLQRAADECATKAFALECCDTTNDYDHAKVWRAAEAAIRRMLPHGPIPAVDEIRREGWDTPAAEYYREREPIIRAEAEARGYRAARTRDVTYLRNVLAANHPHLRDAYYHAAHNIDAGAPDMGAADRIDDLHEAAEAVRALEPEQPK